MARVVKQIIPPQQLGAGTTTVYTVPVNRDTVITRISFTNTTTIDRFVNLWLVPNGGTALAENQLIFETFIAAGETFSPPDVEGQVIPQQSTIQVQAEIAAALTIIGSGNEITS